jgi:hypothetical protein
MLRNANGGWYQSGRVFIMPKRLTIGYEYLDLCINQWPERPSQQQLATQAEVSPSTARKIIIELKNTGSLTDPELTNSENNTTWSRRKSSFLCGETCSHKS